MHELRRARYDGCPGLCMAILRLGVRWRLVPVVAVRQLLGRLRPRAGAADGLLESGGQRRQRRPVGLRLFELRPVDADNVPTDPVGPTARSRRIGPVGRARRSDAASADAAASAGARDYLAVAKALAAVDGPPAAVLRRNIGTNGRIVSRNRVNYADKCNRDLPGGRDTRCPVSG